MEALRQKLQELQDDLDEEKRKREAAERRVEMLESSSNPKTPTTASGIATLDDLLANLDKEIVGKGFSFNLLIFNF